ncbi:hypothetical protein [Tumebacillus flagellatus]|uniref:Uncharacterized protein n=1 Tax=Tumebacillus flagellatus TaxID=1157490 RepID=A0A074LS06_9BACL|nr:hypothetical protein [Tumebacillus flagellatus]KEO83899.1 hypothetical protein EL26_06845 [Tumebacillus flagellatus]
MAAGTLQISRRGTRRPVSVVRRIVVFNFTIPKGQSRSTRSFQLRNVINRGEVIVSQSAAGGALVRYQFVNATTGAPVSNAVTVSGNRTVVLPFSLPAGNDRLRITNIGSTTATVEGAVIIF